MTVFQPDDTFVQGIYAALGNIASAQISGLGTIYTEEPDGPPADNSVTFELVGVRVLDETNAKMDLALTIAIKHWHVKSTGMQELKACRRYMLPFLQAYGSWANQSLGGLARAVSPKVGGTPQTSWAEQVYRALQINVEVLTEIVIPTA